MARISSHHTRHLTDPCCEELDKYATTEEHCNSIQKGSENPDQKVAFLILRSNFDKTFEFIVEQHSVCQAETVSNYETRQSKQWGFSIYIFDNSKSNQWSGWSGRRRWSCLVWYFLER